jgi:hypothetical protein
VLTWCRDRCAGAAELGAALSETRAWESRPCARGLPLPLPLPPGSACWAAAPPSWKPTVTVAAAAAGSRALVTTDRALGGSDACRLLLLRGSEGQADSTTEKPTTFFTLELRAGPLMGSDVDLCAAASGLDDMAQVGEGGVTEKTMAG